MNKYLAILLIIFLASCSNSNNIKVIDLVKVFNSYQLKIDMEHADSIILNKKIREIDSLKGLLEFQKDNIPVQEFNNQIYLLDMDFEKAFQESNNRINEAVWKNINMLTKDFGKKNKIQILIGANSMGSAVYYEDVVDMTNDFILYINENYENNK